MLLAASADGLGASGIQCMTVHYREVADYLGWKDRGIVYVPHMWEPGQVKGTDGEEEARRLGREG